MIIIEDLPFLPSDLLIKKALMNHLQYSIWRQQKVYKSSLQFMEVYSSFYFLWLLETWPVRERETTDWEEECRQWDPATGPLCSIITAPRIINTPGLDHFCQTGLNQLEETRLDVISEENGLQVPYLCERAKRRFPTEAGDLQGGAKHWCIKTCSNQQASEI